MNTRDIVFLLKQDIYTRRTFQGVFPRDKLPRYVLKKPSAYVVNTDPAHRPGKHWVAIFFDGRGHATYFDSFGLPVMFRDIDVFIRNNSIRVEINDRWLQDPISATCGLYVVYFVFMKSRGASLSRLLAPFHPFRTTFNDRKVASIVRASFSRRYIK